MITWEQNSMALDLFGCKYELWSILGGGEQIFQEKSSAKSNYNALIKTEELQENMIYSKRG